MVQPGGDGAEQRDFDERWAQIVAELGPELTVPDDAASGEATRGDASSGEASPDERAAGGRRLRRPRHQDEAMPYQPPGPRELSGRDWDGTSQYEDAEEAVDRQEHYVPPDPGPVHGTDPLRLVTWAVVGGVLVLYFVMLVAWRTPPGWLPAVAGVVLLAAIGVLVWRMPHHRKEDPDSGAVV